MEHSIIQYFVNRDSIEGRWKALETRPGVSLVELAYGQVFRRERPKIRSGSWRCTAPSAREQAHPKDTMSTTPQHLCTCPHCKRQVAVGRPKYGTDNNGKRIRPLNEQDLKDPGIQAQILEIALDFQGINAGHLAPALIALSNTIDLEAFLVEIPSVRTDDTAATIRRAALASLRRNS